MGCSAEQQFTQTILDSLPAHIAVLDQEGRITAVNNAWRLFAAQNGAPGETRIGVGVDYLQACRAAADTGDPYARAALAGIQAVLQRKRRDFTLEYPCDSPTEARWFLMHVVTGPGPLGAVVTHLDLSQRRRAEEALRQSESRFRRALRNSLVTVAVQDRSMVYRWAYHPQSEQHSQMVGKTDADLFGAEDAAILAMPKQHVLDSGEQVHVQHWVTLAGNRRFLDLHYEPTRNAGGEITGIGIAMVDLTEHKLTEEALQNSKRIAESANQAKDHFLAVLSHELRNPLNPVLAVATMLRDDPRFDDDVREHLDVICRNAELEARLIDDLLDVTRIERGKIELHRQTVDLVTTIRQAVEVCMADIKTRELQLTVDTPDHPCWVDGDIARLLQVLWNLLKNAVKFSHTGGRLSIRCHCPQDGHVAVDIADTGEGMDPAALRRIFTPFEQVERSITRQFGGLGLGLAISKALVELHGGAITAHSDGKGKGATFTVTLPLLAKTTAGSTRVQKDAVPRTPTAALRILVVEDHDDTAHVMRRFLVAEGHHVEIAGSVASAIRLASGQVFDMVLSDLGLPDGNGLALMRHLRASGLQFPGIAVSGYGQEKDMHASRQAGFEAHLVKPINLARLKDEIARIAAAHPRVS